MPISAYSTDRDTNAGIVPGNIRVRDPELQQLVNSNRQLMADLAALGITPFIEGLLNDVDALAARTTLGLLWEPIGPLINISNVAAVTWTDLSPYRRIRVSGKIFPATNGAIITGVVSSNNGVSYQTGAADYSRSYVYGGTGPSVTGNSTNGASIPLGIGASASAYGVKFDSEIDDWNKAVKADGIITGHTISDAAVDYTYIVGLTCNTATARDAFRIIATTGNLASGFVTLEGIRG